MTMQMYNAEEIWTSNRDWSITLTPAETDLEFMYVYFNNVEFKVPVAGMSTITWSPPAEFFSEGVNSVSIRYDDFAQNPGKSWVFNLILDTTAPDQPRILYADDDVGSKTDFVKNNGRTDDESPMLAGLAERNSLVKIYDAQNREIGSVKANDNGFWEIELPLGEGDHALYVTATDKMGHVSKPSDPFNITIGPDVVLPEPGIALITHAWDDAGTVATGRLESGALTDDTTPTLHGTAPANSTVEIQYRALNGSWISGGSVTALADGSWSWTPETALGEGSWEFRVGNGSWSDEFVLEIDRTPQDRVTLTHAWDDEGPYPGPLGNGAVTDDHTPTFHGRAEANSLVYVHYRSAGGDWTRLGSAVAGPDGNWTLTSSMLTNGDYEFTAGASSTSPGSNPPLFSLTLVDDDPLSPQITGIYDDFGGSTGYLHEPRQTDDRTPRLEGRAPVGSLVVIYQNGAPVGSVLAENGLWQFDVPPLTDGGTYRFSSAIRDASGKMGPRSEAWEMELLVEQPDPMMLTFSRMTADSGTSASDWITNDGSANRTVSGTLSRTLAQGETLLVYNGLEWLRAAVNGLTWTLVDPAAHSSSWRYEAYVENAIFGTELGNIRQSVTFDNAIVKPTISGVYDDSGSGEQLIPPDGSTTDSTPLLRGTAESGSMVYIYREGTDALIGSVKAENGQWEFIASGVTAGENSFYVRSTDAAGNSDASESYEFSYQSAQGFWDFDRLYKPEPLAYTVVGTRYKSNGMIAIAGGGSSPIDSLIFTNEAGDGFLAFYGLSPALEFINPIHQFEFDYKRFASGTLDLAFHDQEGYLIERIKLPNANGEFKYFKSKLYDIPIGKIVLENNDESVVMVDNIKVDYSPQPKTSKNLITDETNQDILDDSVSKLDQDENKLSTQPIISASTTEVISVDNVLEQGFSNFFIDNGTKQLMITGDASDTVQLDDLLPDGTDSGDWIVQNGTVTVAGIEYQVYTHSGEEAEVLIQQGIKTELI